MIAFRIDDYGIDHDSFNRLQSLFEKHYVKFSVGVIPSLIEGSPEVNRDLAEVWCHGYSHKNWGEEKKSEYPELRSQEEVKKELEKSYQICLDGFGNLFCRGFIPPWNRFYNGFDHCLSESGFRFFSADKLISSDLKQMPVHLDVHTDKERSFTGARLLLREVEGLIIEHGFAHVMLHHNHMSELDFDVLDVFLTQISRKYPIKWPTEIF